MKLIFILLFFPDTLKKDTLWNDYYCCRVVTTNLITGKKDTVLQSMRINGMFVGKRKRKRKKEGQP